MKLQFTKQVKDGCGSHELSRSESKCGRYAIQKNWERPDAWSDYRKATSDWEVFTVDKEGNYSEKIGEGYTLKEAKKIAQDYETLEGCKASARESELIVAIAETKDRLDALEVLLKKPNINLLTESQINELGQLLISQSKYYDKLRVEKAML